MSVCATKSEIKQTQDKNVRRLLHFGFCLLLVLGLSFSSEALTGAGICSIISEFLLCCLQHFDAHPPGHPVQTAVAKKKKGPVSNRSRLSQRGRNRLCVLSFTMLNKVISHATTGNLNRNISFDEQAQGLTGSVMVPQPYRPCRFVGLQCLQERK